MLLAWVLALLLVEEDTCLCLWSRILVCASGGGYMFVSVEEDTCFGTCFTTCGGGYVFVPVEEDT